MFYYIIVYDLLWYIIYYGPQTSHNGQFFQIEIYTSSESWINNLSIDVWFVMIGQYWRYNYF